MLLLRHNPRFMLVGLVSRDQNKDRLLADLEELESLVHTYGGRVYALAVQNSARRDNATFIGKGKAYEVADTILREKIDIVILNAQVKSQQLFNLKKVFESTSPSIIVWDRIGLILEIFSKHATTSEAKLQIQLANMHHMGPRIYGMGKVLSQQTGGIGTRGIGETNTELMQRHWRNEIRNIHQQLKKQDESRRQQMERRKRNGLPTISIVGYTNSGKTTLFNMLAGKNNQTDNALFVTLDSSVGTLYLPSLRRNVFLSDTIGFIQNLPHKLIDAFKSTLLETVHADLLLHVIDVNDPWKQDKIAVVEQVLLDLEINTKRQIYVFNKIDISKEVNKEDLLKKYYPFHPQFVSAKTSEGKDILIETISKNLPLSHA